MPAIIDDKGDVKVTCDCGKPIVKANIYGMFCEDKCGMEESIKLAEALDEMIKGINSRLG